MDFDKKTLFSQLDDEMKKSAKKNDKKEKKKKKVTKDDAFGFGFDPKDFEKKKKKKKSKDKDKKKKDKKDKPKKEKKEKYVPLGHDGDYESLKPDSKISKLIMKEIRNKALKEDFKHDRVLINSKKFWSKD